MLLNGGKESEQEGTMPLEELRFVNYDLKLDNIADM